MLIKPSSLITDPGHFLALGFGTGCSPIVPGTVSTLVFVPLCWLALHLPVLWYGLLTLVLALLGVYLCGRTTRALGVDDHRAIVWDELVGFFITMLAAPPTFIYLAAGFVLFRFFDILKPWPVNAADNKLHGGIGIMMDDILAGVYAFISLNIIAGLMGF